MAKNMYHGALRDLIQQGGGAPVQITVKTGPTKSKYPGKPDYCTFTIQGEDFYYTFDSEQCKEFVTQHKGQTLFVLAEGSREESMLTAVGVPASSLPPKQAAPAPAARPAPAPTRAPATPPAQHQPPSPPHPEGMDTLAAAKQFVGRNRVLAVVALEAAFHTKMEFEAAKQYELPEAAFAALFTAMLFGASANGFTAANQGLPLDLKFKPYQQSTAR